MDCVQNKLLKIANKYYENIILIKKKNQKLTETKKEY